MPSLWYAPIRSKVDGSQLFNEPKGRRGRPRKKQSENGHKTMTPTQQTQPTQQTPNEQPTKQVQKTVFDLASFDDVKLVKNVALPAPVTTVKEALEALGNDESRLLKVINAGLVDSRIDEAREDRNGWHVEDSETGDALAEEYNGKYADGDVSKTINSAILNFAKMLAMGSGGWDNLKGETGKAKKAELKAMAVKQFRENPAILASLSPASAPAPNAESTPASA